jgi:glucose/mannose-6-phosphate isomerase
VLLASYSGNTEETLACYEAAQAAGSPCIAVTTGGQLAEQARADGFPVIGLPGGMQPRAAVAYMTVAVLECAALCNAAPSLRTEVDAAGAYLAELAGRWGPDADDDSTAKRLARRLLGSLPVIYGGGATAPVAYRWKTEINENAKHPAFSARLPEADHNEICGYAAGTDPAPVFAVFLEDTDQHPRVRERIEITCRVIAEGAAGIERVASRGGTGVERVMSLVFLGDLVSVYLAVLRGVDPTPVEVIERLKAELA